MRDWSSSESSEKRVNVPTSKKECRREFQMSSRLMNSQRSMTRGLKSSALESASGTPRSLAEGQPGAAGKNASQIEQRARYWRGVNSMPGESTSFGAGL